MIRPSNFAALQLAVMKYERYPVVASNDFQMYLFFSEGPKGKISKGVVYSKIDTDVYNLSFGDWMEGYLQLDDTRRTNNGDRDKVLATVASTVLDFFHLFPNVRIIIEGSTLARTRLYQMSIGHNLPFISQDFQVDGLWNNDWEPFRLGRNYEAFSIQENS